MSSFLQDVLVFTGVILAENQDSRVVSVICLGVVSQSKSKSKSGPQSQADSPFQEAYDAPFPGRVGWSAAGHQAFTRAITLASYIDSVIFSIELFLGWFVTF